MISTLKMFRFLFPLIALADLCGCRLIEDVLVQQDKVTVDFLAPLDLKVNALAPQVVLADSTANRVFVACTNSSSVSMIDCATGRVTNIAVGSRIPRGLRKEGMKVSSQTGKLYICGARKLIVVDPRAGDARSIPLPGDFEAIDLDEKQDRAFLTGRTCADLAVVEVAAGRVRLVPYGKAAPPLPFKAASAPPPIRMPFLDQRTGRVHVVDGIEASLFTIDVMEEKVVNARNLPVDPIPRWHTAGFSPGRGRIYVVLEDGDRKARHALAIDTEGTDDVVLDLPEGHSEPAGVICDVLRGELYVPYDNMKLIHVVTFTGEGEIGSIPLPAAGVDASDYDPEKRVLYVTGWNQAALYFVDVEARKTTFTVPFFPVYPHMNSMAFNRRDGKLYVPTGSTAVNGSFGTGVTVFEPGSLAFSEIRTGWGPVSLVQKPGSESFFVFGADREFAEVAPDGTCRYRRLPHPYPHQALASPDEQHVLVAYGPHSSMWPTFYIGGTRNGICILDSDGQVVEDRLTPRLVQGMAFDKEHNLWALQNTWGREAPFLLCFPSGDEGWFDLRLPPKVDNECLLRVMALDPESGLLYVGRPGNLQADKGMVHAVDPKARKVLGAFEVGRTPTGICILPESSKVYVTNFDDDTVSILEGIEGEVKHETVGSRPIAVGAYRATGTVYVVNHLGESLTILGREKKTVPLPDGALPDNIVVDPLSGCAFISAHSQTEARVYQYYPEGDKIRTLHTFSHPYGEVNFDRSEAAFQLRGQWGDCLFRITEMVIDDWGRLWVADYLSGKLWILSVR